MKASETKVDRRKFLAGVAVAGATAASIKTAKAAPTPANAGRLPAVLPPTAHEIAVETGAVHELHRKEPWPARLRFHGRRDQIAEDRLRLFQPGLELPRLA